MNIQRMMPILLVLLLIAVPTLATEIGVDQRISYMGFNGDPGSDVKTPVMAYNPTDNQALMVWSADAVDGKFQIWGQRIHAPTGALAGGAFQISFSDPDSAQWDALEPDVVFNPGGLEYLVVWSSDESNDGAEEIYGQRISRYGELVGPLGFRISDMGANDADPTFDANRPTVAWNSIDGQYCVMWSGDDDALTAEGDFQIFVQFLAPDGTEVGANDFLAGQAFNDLDFYDPSLAHNPVDNEYMVAFEVSGVLLGYTGPEVGGFIVDSDGTLLTPQGFFVGQMGAWGLDEYHSKNPAVEWDAVSNQYLVAFDADDVGFNEEFEIYACWIAPTTGAINIAPTRLSDAGNDGTVGGYAIQPALAHDSNLQEYMVVWQGTEIPAGFSSPAEPEIYGQLFDLALAEVGTNDFRLSDMGPDPYGPWEAASATAIYNPAQEHYLIGWAGDDQDGVMAVGEEEAHIQRFGATATPVENKPGPRRLALHANVPNPFNPSTTISFDVPEGAPMVSLRIYDAAGRLVRTLVQSKLSAGQHQVQWQGRDDSGHSVASGVYHLKMEAGEFKSSRKMALVQ